MNNQVKIQKIIKTLFKNSSGEPFDATQGQADIFKTVASDNIPRATIKAYTQYGKSDITAMAINFLCLTTSKKIIVVAPRQEQARIIMDYVIGHIFDNPLFIEQVEIEGSLDRFKRERSKTRIDWKTGARIMILTADTRTVSQESRNLMGFGADIVIVDESSLIPDNMFSKILRMIGGRENGKIVQLGNPFDRNHFFQSFLRDNYKKITIDYTQGIKEGRITQDFINEMKDTLDPIDFTIFYETKFPDSVTNALIPLSKIEAAVNRSTPEGSVHFGGDVARFGDDKTVAIVRKGGKVTRIETWGQEDTMTTAKLFKDIILTEKPETSNIDAIGIGAGVVDKLLSDYVNVTGINVGSQSSNKERYVNLRAELFWNLREKFTTDDISIPDDKELILQLSEIKYSYQTGKIRIESKDSMKKRGLKSPDKADALALAFAPRKTEDEVVFSFG